MLNKLMLLLLPLLLLLTLSLPVSSHAITIKKSQDIYVADPETGGQPYLRVATLMLETRIDGCPIVPGTESSAESSEGPAMTASGWEWRKLSTDYYTSLKSCRNLNVSLSSAVTYQNERATNIKIRLIAQSYGNQIPMTYPLNASTDWLDGTSATLTAEAPLVYDVSTPHQHDYKIDGRADVMIETNTSNNAVGIIIETAYFDLESSLPGCPLAKGGAGDNPNTEFEG